MGTKRSILIAVLVSMMAAGCATMNPGGTDKSSAANKGPFRARWWSYYDRACVQIASENFKEAEADLMKAMRGRDADSWQTRTYGLHFIEYFPNREYGIVCYHLGRLDEAEKCLSDSLKQVDTDRAHYFLDQVTRAKIAKGDIKSDTPPAVETNLPAATLTASVEIPVEIKAKDDVGVSKVTVNGQEVHQRGSKKELASSNSVVLPEGTHKVEVKATNLAEKEVTKTVEVKVDLTGPTVGIFAPIDPTVTEQTLVRLEGTAVDKNGVVSVALGTRMLAEAKAQSKLEFTTELPLSGGENTFVICSKDVAGNETRSSVKVFRGRPDSTAAKLWLLRQVTPQRLMMASAASPGLAPQLTFAVEGLKFQAEAAPAAAPAPEAAPAAPAAAPAADPAAAPVADPAAAPATAAVPPQQLTINVKSPDPEKPYRHNRTLRVAGDVLAPVQLASLSVNGQAVEELTGAPKESFNKRIPLEPGAGANGEQTVKVQIIAKDTQGGEMVRDIDVKVQPVQMNSQESKMPVAVLAFSGSDVDPAVAAKLRLDTEGQLLKRGRFSIVDRTQLQAVLTEQQLASALADPNQALQLGKVVNAQAFIVADLFKRDQNGVELKARVINSETSELLKTLDVFIDDKDNSEKVTSQCDALADQLEKTFPRLSGSVLAVKAKDDGAEMLVDWTADDGVREGMYMLVVKEDEPFKDDTTGEVLEPGETIIVERGKVQSILTNGSKAKVIKKQDGSSVPVEKGMAVITM